MCRVYIAQRNSCRSVICRGLCMSSEPDVLLVLCVRFSAGKTRPGTRSLLHPDVREIAYCLNIMGPDNAVTRKKAYEGVKAMYKSERQPVEKARLLQSLTCAVDEELQDDLLTMILSDAVPLQEVGILLQHLGQRGGKAFEKTWNFLIQ